jgi:hypothetical protein
MLIDNYGKSQYKHLQQQVREVVVVDAMQRKEQPRDVISWRASYRITITYRPLKPSVLDIRVSYLRIPSIFILKETTLHDGFRNNLDSSRITSKRSKNFQRQSNNPYLNTNPPAPTTNPPAIPISRPSWADSRLATLPLAHPPHPHPPTHSRCHAL